MTNSYFLIERAHPRGRVTVCGERREGEMMMMITVLGLLFVWNRSSKRDFIDLSAHGFGFGMCWCVFIREISGINSRSQPQKPDKSPTVAC